MYFDKKFFAKVLSLAKGDRTNQQFADDSGVSRPYISMLLNLKREDPPTPDILKKLAIAAHNNITYAQLMVAAGYVYWTDKELGEIYEVGGTNPENIKFIHSSGIGYFDIPDKVVRIPVLGSIPAGRPLEAVEDIIDYIDIPESWQDGDRKYFGLVVKGNSMYPEYLEGDIVIIRKQPCCDSGDDCAVILDNEMATLKRVHINQNGIELEAINPMYGRKKYTSQEIKALPVTILGVVVEQRRKRK